MGRHAPGSVSIGRRTAAGLRIPLGLAVLFTLLFGFQARAAEHVGDYRVVNAPPNAEITVTHDRSGDKVSATTDASGRATLPIGGRRWTPGAGQLHYIDPRLPAYADKWVELKRGDHVINLGWGTQPPEQRGRDSVIKHPFWHLGAGWGRGLNENDPSGGGIIVQGRVDYPLHDRWSVGAGLGYAWLGSTTTTWLGQTGSVTLSATPLWAEIVYDFKDRGNDMKYHHREWWEHEDPEHIGENELDEEGEGAGLLPYAALGGGPYWRRVGGDFDVEDDTALDFGMNLGLGLDNISHQGDFGIGLEVRYHNVIQSGLKGFQMVTANINVNF